MRVTIQDLKAMKQRGEKFPMLTAYDYTTAKILDEAGIPIILVGDSLGMVVLGYESTIPVTMEDMLHHTRAVARGAPRALVIMDMPFMSYTISVTEALRNAARALQEGGAQGVKIEGGQAIAETVRRIVECGIPVMGHIGLTPQSVHQLSGYKVQGRDVEGARKVLADALALEQAGAFSVVLECIPAPLAKVVTERLSIPTIGIGAGPHCDGQVQVVSDILGLFRDFVPKHAKQYAQLGEIMKDAVGHYSREVREGAFPTIQQSFGMNEQVLAAVLGERAKA